MNGKPLTFRLMDPPLHEFVPHTEEKQRALAKERGISFEEIKKRIDALNEVNPMMGLRGVRLGIVYLKMAADSSLKRDDERRMVRQDSLLNDSLIRITIERINRGDVVGRIIRERYGRLLDQ